MTLIEGATGAPSSRSNAGADPHVANAPSGGSVGSPDGSGASGRKAIGPTIRTVLERARFLVVIGAVTALALGGVAFVRAVVKSVAFVLVLIGIGQGSEDIALVKLFETIDVILIGTVLLLVLVVRFLESLVSQPSSAELLELGIAVTLVGALLLAFANWRPSRRGREQATTGQGVKPLDT